MDLTAIKGVEYYLSETSFAASSVTPLSGGNANFTYRIVLRNPYKYGSTLPIRTMVLKHAEPYVARMKSIPFAADRQDFEAFALKYVPHIIDPSPIVSVPELYYEDCDHRVMLISDSGVTSSTLKALYQMTPPSEEVSRIIGRSLGTFLARLHNATSVGAPSTHIKTLFANNQQAREIVTGLSYGSLIPTIAPENQNSCIINPPLNLSAVELDIVARVAKAMQERIMTSEDVLAMGDFWPGNILISFTPELHVNVVDWEAARPGLAGLEIGQFLAEMYTLRTFHPLSLLSVDCTISSFLAAYRDLRFQDNTAQRDWLEVAWDAATHFGTHLITTTPRVPWGSTEQTREVVLDGLNYIFGVAERDEAWLQTSIIQGLLPGEVTDKFI